MLLRINILLALLVGSTASLFSQWSLVHVNPDSYALNDIHAVGTLNQGFAVGDYGAVKKITGTENTNGMIHYTWTVSRIKTEQSLKVVRMLKENTAVTAGESGALYKTTNYGTTWNKIPTPTNETIVALEFANGKLGVAITEQNTVLISNDAGDTWTINSEKLPESKLRVKYVNDTTWVAAGTCSNGKATVFVSKDRITWNAVVVNSVETPRLQSIQVTYPNNATTPTILVAGDYWAMMKSTDFGATWEKVVVDNMFAYQTPGYEGYGFGMSPDGKVGMFLSREPNSVRTHAVSLYTTNGGESWTDFRIQRTSFNGDHSNSYCFTSDSGFVACDMYGGVYENQYSTYATFLNFYTYRESNYGGSFDKIYRFDAQRIAVFPNSNTITFYQSQDEGNTWQSYYPYGTTGTWNRGGLYSPEPGVFYVTSGKDTSYHVGNTYYTAQSAYIARSTDNGITWSRQKLDGSISVSAFKMFDKQNGMLLTSGDYYQVSTNGGASWLPKAYNKLPNCTYVMGVRIMNSSTFEVVMYDTSTRTNRYLYTDNEGQSWKELNYNDHIFARNSAIRNPDGSLTYVTSTTGTNYTGFDTVWVSKDDGTTWNALHTAIFDSTQRFNKTYSKLSAALNGKYGFYGGLSKCLVTSDSGKTWVTDTTFLSLWRNYACGPVDAIYTSNNEFLMASGSGVLLKYNPFSTTSDIHEEPLANDNTVTLKQVGNTVTLQSASTVHVSIYSIDGKVLWSGTIEQSTTKELSVQDFTSGVYVVQYVHNGVAFAKKFSIVR